MSYRLRVLARPEVAAGFGLAGIPTIDAATDAIAAERLTELLDQPDVGVVLMEEGAHRHLPDELQRGVARRPLPMIVPFPGAEWQAEAAPDSYIVELLRRVIGYRVRLR